MTEHEAKLLKHVTHSQYAFGFYKLHYAAAGCIKQIFKNCGKFATELLGLHQAERFLLDRATAVLCKLAQRKSLPIFFQVRKIRDNRKSLYE